MTTIPDTHNGPLYRSWARLRDSAIVSDLAWLRRNNASMRLPVPGARAAEPASAQPETQNPKPETSLTAQVLAQFNGHPLSVKRVTGVEPQAVRCICATLAKRGVLRRVGWGTYQRVQTS